MLKLTVGQDGRGRWLAVVTDEHGDKTMVLDVDHRPTQAEAEARGREMIEARDGSALSPRHTLASVLGIKAPTFRAYCGEFWRGPRHARYFETPVGKFQPKSEEERGSKREEAAE